MTTDIATVLEHAWLVLANEPRVTHGDIPTHTLGSLDIGAGVLQVGLTGNGERHLYIPVTEHAKSREDRRSQGIQIVEHTFGTEGQNQRFVDVHCKIPAFNEVFNELAISIINKIRSGGDPFGISCQTLEEYRQFLRDERFPRLSDSQLLGLVAELLVLQECVSRSPGIIEAWQGPLGGRHDLVGQSASIEVKATTRTAGRIIHINSLRQLEQPEFGQLFLAVLVLEDTPIGSISLPSLVEQVMAVPGIDVALFNDRLKSAGCLNPMEYENEKFSLIENLLFIVDEQFPKITKVQTGITAIEYDIDLTGEPPGSLGEQQRSEVLRLMTQAN